jgi:hypothetical protein
LGLILKNLSIRKICLAFIIIPLCVIGTCSVLDKIIGDGFLPAFTPSKYTEQKAITQLKNGQDYQASLQTVFRILRTVNPPIAYWLKRQTVQYQFVFPIDHPQYKETKALHIPFINMLLLGPGFWKETDLDKAAIIVHEYRHSRQNFAKTIGERTSQFLSGQAFLNPDATRLEDEAYLYQAAFYQAVGAEPDWLWYHLQARGY